MKLHPSLSALLSLSLLVPATALAQDEVGGEGEAVETAETTSTETPEGTAEATSPPSLEAPTGAMVGPFTRDTYPLSFIHRPLTLPAGMMGAGVGLSHVRMSVATPAGTVDADSTGLGLAFAYGVTDQAQVGLATGFGIDPDAEWGEFINFDASYLAYDSEKIDVAANANITFSFVDQTDALNVIGLGPITRVLLTDQLYVLGGHDMIVWASDPSWTNLNLNAGLGFEAMPQLDLELSTQFFSLAVAGDNNESTTLGDVIPLAFNVAYAVNTMLDVSLSLNFPSLEDAGDFMMLGLGASYRM